MNKAPLTCFKSWPGFMLIGRFLWEIDHPRLFSLQNNVTLSLTYLSCKKHLKIKGIRNYYFKTIGYCSKTKVKSSLILRRFYATWPWALTLGLKCYYLWELYHAWVLVITLMLSTDVPVQSWGLSELTKSEQKLKPFKYTSRFCKSIL